MTDNANETPPTALPLYDWQANTLLAATVSLDSQWLIPQADLAHSSIDGQNNSNIDSLPTNPINVKPFNDISETAALSLSSTRIITDTRQLQAGDIFLALAGENFDGHDYIESAATKGAIAAIVSRPTATRIPQLQVSDTRLALGQLAAYRRQQHPNIKIVALTGSSGKTTCKEMLGSIFGRLAPTLITRGNLNNDLGAPMTLLELSDQHQYAIIELGANHVGEIAYTADLVQPEVACVLNVGTAHLGEFGSRERICQAKAEIYQPLSQQQYAIVPDEDDFASELRQVAQRYTHHILGFGSSDITASAIKITADASEFKLQIADQTCDIKLPLAGEHNVTNALAAAACATALGIAISDIAAGLNQASPAKGRLTSIMLGEHRLIDDTYNANPHSVRAAASVLAAQSGTRIMVLGDIAELGESSAREHHSLGRSIAESDIDMLLCVGDFATDSVAGAAEVGGIYAIAFNDKTLLLEYLQDYLNGRLSSLDGSSAPQLQPSTLLFKGSRSAQMETLIAALLEE